MPFLPAHDQAISAYIGDFLETEASKISNDHDARQTMRAIVSSAKRAIADFSERWNARSSVHIPPELLALCFAALPFQDLMSVLRVSRHWHAVALGTPELWATFSISGSGRLPRKLSEMLRRSQAAPLSIELTLRPDEEAELRPHFSRLRELECANHPEEPLDMPILRKLKVCSGDKGPVVLSAEYIAGAADSLETLELQKFVLEPSCPRFPKLRVFDAVIMPGLETCISSLLPRCPALQSLTVRWAAERGSDPRRLFVPLPPLLRDVYISGFHVASKVDFAMLQPWVGHPFRTVRLDGLRRISGVLEWFLSSHSHHQWSLALSRDFSSWICSLSALAAADSPAGTTHPDVEATVEIRAPTSSGRVVLPFVGSLGPLQTQFDSLTICAFSPKFFAQLIVLGVQLPALSTLTLTVNPIHDGDLGAGLEIPSAPIRGISAPRLSSFLLTYHRSYVCPRQTLESFCTTLRRELQTWVQYDAPRLERLIFKVRLKDSFSEIVQHSKVYELAQIVRLKAPQ